MTRDGPKICEITNEPYMRSNYEKLSKLRLLTYQTINYDDYDAGTNTSGVKSVYDTSKVRFDIAIRSLSKRSQGV